MPVNRSSGRCTTPPALTTSVFLPAERFLAFCTPAVLDFFKDFSFVAIKFTLSRWNQQLPVYARDGQRAIDWTVIFAWVSPDPLERTMKDLFGCALNCMMRCPPPIRLLVHRTEWSNSAREQSSNGRDPISSTNCALFSRSSRTVFILDAVSPKYTPACPSETGRVDLN